MKLQVLFLLGATTCCFAQVRFDDFQVYRVTPRTTAQLHALRQLEENPRGLNFGPMLAHQEGLWTLMKYDFQDLISLQELDAEVWIENVQELINNEKRVAPKNSEEHDWNSYQTLNEINAWLDGLVEKYPGIVTPIVGGSSYEGREIRGVKVSFGPGKKGVFIESGIHACECNFAGSDQLLSSTDPSVRKIAESRDWHVFPSVNPDGFVYTHTTNRLWRKTRKPYGSCYGADPNRNWGYHWMDGGASSSPCLETHAGSSAFSEIETKSLSEYITSVADTFHSYGQLLLIPFGHQGLEVPENSEELLRIGNAAAKSLAVRYGTNYTVGNIPETVYVASGISMDWAVGVHRNIRMAYTFELRDTGRYGFLLPPELIIPIGDETLDSVITIISEADA